MGDKMLLNARFVIVSLFVIGARCDDSGCPPGFRHYEEACYAYVGKWESWFAAQGLCKTLGGHLAEPKSYEENIFVKGLALDNGNHGTWIGATDLLTEGLWYWANSHRSLNETAFTDWRPGEPNNQNYDEDCLLMQGVRWEDVNCDNRAPFYVSVVAAQASLANENLIKQNQAFASIYTLQRLV